MYQESDTMTPEIDTMKSMKYMKFDETYKIQTQWDKQHPH